MPLVGVAAEVVVTSLPVRHQDFNRVKISLTQKTVTEVGSWIHCCLALVAAWTHKPEYPSTSLLGMAKTSSITNLISISFLTT